MNKMCERKTIMVVDDEPDVLLSVAQILDANNYRTIKARDGQECLHKLKTESPDILLLDIMMPGLTTKEILREIEKDSRLSGMKILFLTAVHLQEAEEEDLFAFKQVVGLIGKPFSVRELLDSIEKAIQR